jgi:hypothetical protein
MFQNDMAGPFLVVRLLGAQGLGSWAPRTSSAADELRGTVVDPFPVDQEAVSAESYDRHGQRVLAGSSRAGGKAVTSLGAPGEESGGALRTGPGGPRRPRGWQEAVYPFGPLADFLAAFFAVPFAVPFAVAFFVGLLAVLLDVVLDVLPAVSFIALLAVSLAALGAVLAVR